MASITSQDFSRVFNENTGFFNLTDLTDLAGLGINPADVVGWYVIVAPSGLTIHSGSLGSPDFTGVLPTTNTIALPLDANGDVQIGNYTFTQYINVVGAVLPGTYDLEVTVNYCPDYPEIIVAESVSCLTATVSVQDNSDYTDWTTVSRLFSLYNAKRNQSGSPYTTVGTLITQNSSTTTIWNGSWEWTLVAVLSRIYSNYSVIISVDEFEEFEVDCAEICAFRCKLDKLLNIYYSNPSAKTSMLPDIILATGLLLDIVLSRDCGVNYDTRANQLQAIFDKYSITEDCGCGTDSPVTPVSGSVPTINITDVGSVVATPLGGGNWQISLTTTAEDTLANVYNTNAESTALAPGEVALDVTLTIDNTTTPPTHIYNLRIPAGTIPTSADYGNTWSGTFRTSWAAGVALLGPHTQTNYGNHLQAPTIEAINGSVISWQSQEAIYKISLFHTASGTNTWKLECDIIDSTLGVGRSTGKPQVEVYDVERDVNPLNDYALLRIFDTSTGNVMTWGSLQNFLDNYFIQLIIHE